MHHCHQPYPIAKEMPAEATLEYFQCFSDEIELILGAFKFDKKPEGKEFLANFPRPETWIIPKKKGEPK